MTYSQPCSPGFSAHRWLQAAVEAEGSPSHSQLLPGGNEMASRPGGQHPMPADSNREDLARRLSLYASGQQPVRRWSEVTHHPSLAEAPGKSQPSQRVRDPGPESPVVLQKSVSAGELRGQHSNDEDGAGAAALAEQDPHLSQQVPRIIFRDGSPMRSKPSVVVQLGNKDGGRSSPTPPPEQQQAAAELRRDSPPATISSAAVPKRNTVEFGALPSATEARARSPPCGHAAAGMSNSARFQRMPQLHSLPSERRPPPKYSDRLAEGLILVPRSDEPESPWSLPSPFSQPQESASASMPMAFRVPHAMGTGAKFVSRQQPREYMPSAISITQRMDSHRMPMPEDRQPHVVSNAVHPMSSYEGVHQQRSHLDAESHRPISPINDHLSEIMRPPKKRRSSPTGPREVRDRADDQSREIALGEQALSFSYMVQQQQQQEAAQASSDSPTKGKGRGAGKAGAGRGAAGSVGKGAPGAKPKPAKQSKAAQKREEKAAAVAKTAAKAPTKPLVQQMSALEQLANAASLQAERESEPDPTLKPSAVLPEAVRAGHSRDTAQQSQDFAALESTGRASGVPPTQPGNVPEPGVSHPPGLQKPVVNGAALSGSSLPPALLHSVPGRMPNPLKHQQDPDQQQGPPRGDDPSIKGERGEPGDLPSLSSGGVPLHSASDREYVMSSAYEMHPQSLTWMRGFHSDPAASMAYRPEQQCQPMMRCISADIMAPSTKSPAPLAPLLPQRQPSQAASHQGPGNAAMALHAGANLWSGRIKHRLGTTDGQTSTVELFSGSAAFPEVVLEQLPPVVFIGNLASRDQVRLRKHSVHHMQLAALTQKQHAKLLSLAAMKLVGMSRLQHYDLLFVFEADAHNRVQVILIAQSDDAEPRSFPV